jgi:type II secretory pathway component PulK
MRPARVHASDRRGTALVVALVLLFVLTMVIAATALTTREGLSTADRYARRARAREAVDAGIAASLSRLASSQAQEFAMKGELAQAAYDAQCRPLSPERCELRVTAREERGAEERAEMELAREVGHGAKPVWKVVGYREQTPAAAP